MAHLGRADPPGADAELRDLRVLGPEGVAVQNTGDVGLNGRDGGASFGCRSANKLRQIWMDLQAVLV